MPNNPWPVLILEEWQDTLATLHMWTQIVGKIRMEQTPLINHWWNVTLYVSARGLATSAMPYQDRIFEIEFDFIDHQLRIECSDGASKILPLRPQSVEDFYRELMSGLGDLGINVKIWPMPVEIPNPIRFDQDQVACSTEWYHTGRRITDNNRIPIKMNRIFFHIMGTISAICFGKTEQAGGYSLLTTYYIGDRP